MDLETPIDHHDILQLTSYGQYSALTLNLALTLGSALTLGLRLMLAKMRPV